MARTKRELPENVRVLDTGRYSLQFEVTEHGKTRRLSGNAILRNVPRSFATLDEALEARGLVRTFLASTADRHTTTLGFWERWTDEDHAIWGSEMTGRDRDTYVVYRSRTHKFVKRYADRQIASLTEKDVRDYLNDGGVGSQLVTISNFFKDAMSEGLRSDNPAGELARTANRAANHRRRTAKRKRKPPQRDAVELMLTRASEPVFPRSLYGWMLTGVRTGMRGGEIDGMVWEFLEDDIYWIGHQLHYRSNTLEDPKHQSFRHILLPADVMHEIEAMRGNGSPYIWVNGYSDPWRQDARERWWHWCSDGGQTLRSTVGGATMYQATRHHWAYYALNVLHMPVPQIAKLYGHKDGGKTLLEYYADPDNDTAIDTLRAAYAAQPADLNARRRAA